MRFLSSIIFLFLFAYTIPAQNIYRFAGTGYMGYTPDGNPANGNPIGNPYGLCADNSGNIYFVEGGVLVRKINSLGIITTIVGNSTSVPGFSGDGGPATSAQLNYADGIAVDGSGNIYIADYMNCRIRKINSSGIINTIAGIGTTSLSGDGGPATSAEIGCPAGIAVDLSGNIYFSDQCNHVIRKINSLGIISTIVGTGVSGFSGDGGPATSAQVYVPYGITFDAAGNLYFADMFNARIRKINTTGIISTIGVSASVRFLSSDASGNIYFMGGPGPTIKKLNTLGVISSVAGNGTSGMSGDGGPALSAEIAFVYGITLDANNNFYFGQQPNGGYYQCIRVVCQSACLAGIFENEKDNSTIKIYPNPTTNNLFIESEQTNFQNSQIEIVNYIGQTVLKTEFKTQIDVSQLASGFYTLMLKDNSGSVLTKKFVKE